jgi:hypothetical protein
VQFLPCRLPYASEDCPGTRSEYVNFYLLTVTLLRCLFSATQRELFASALRCLELMLVNRRKQIGDARAAAFIKRLILLAVVLPAASAIAVLAACRKYFIVRFLVFFYELHSLF